MRKPGPDTIRFTLNKQHNICVKARINQSDTLTLMYHSSATGVTLTKDALKQKKIPLNDSKPTDVQTWGGDATSEYSEGNTLTINNLKCDSIWVFINENSGQDTDGKFGFDFFESKILEIDYDNQRMVASHAAQTARRLQKDPVVHPGVAARSYLAN
ncbi:MAG: aspartyl protease family protein [Saprospiraceae bacterium]|nr:aspartyl protease family protein [Saprospiraceae bacterium]